MNEVIGDIQCVTRSTTGAVSTQFNTPTTVSFNQRIRLEYVQYIVFDATLDDTIYIDYPGQIGGYLWVYRAVVAGVTLYGLDRIKQDLPAGTSLRWTQTTVGATSRTIVTLGYRIITTSEGYELAEQQPGPIRRVMTPGILIPGVPYV